MELCEFPMALVKEPGSAHQRIQLRRRRKGAVISSQHKGSLGFLPPSLSEEWDLASRVWGHSRWLVGAVTVVGWPSGQTADKILVLFAESASLPRTPYTTSVQ